MSSPLSTLAKAACVFLIVFAVCPLANAGLVLVVDSAANTAFFSGSDSGEPTGPAGIQELLWSTGVLPGGFHHLTPGVNFSAAPGSFGLTLGDGAVEFGANYNGLAHPGTVTITGDSVPFSYATASVTQQNFLEGLVGTTIPFSLGSNFSDIRVQAVPEPSSFLFLGLVASGGLAYRRKQTLTFFKRG